MIIGSTAIRHWYPDFRREPKDIDIVYHPDLPRNKNFYKRKYPNNKLEFLENSILYEHVKKGTLYLQPNQLYTLKMSHLFWDINWDKHMFDVQFLKNKGCKLDRNLFDKLYKYWESYHGKNKRSDLKMTSKEFFNNALTFPIEHDRIHDLLIEHEYFQGQREATYTKILQDGEEVDVSMEKFQNLTEKEKFNVVFEEVAVMGIERFPRTMYYKKIFDRMLKKFIISHCKIDEAIWIIENYRELVCNIPFDFSKFIWEKIDKTLINGKNN